MKIATYNVNGIRGRLDILVKWLKTDKPDVVCLQELKTSDPKFPHAALEKAGYGAVWHGQASWNGVAILARDQDPILIRKALPGDAADRDSRYIEAAVDGICIACLYLPNGNPAPGPRYDYKLRWFARLLAHTQGLLDLGIPAVLAGDFNVMPTDLDVYKPERWRKDALFRPEVREAYATLLAQGWTDTIRHLHPDESAYTFWKYWRQSFERDAGLRIDHILLSPDLAPALRSADVRRAPRGWEGTSDHTPVMIEIDNLQGSPNDDG